MDIRMLFSTSKKMDFMHEKRHFEYRRLDLSASPHQKNRQSQSGGAWGQATCSGGVSLRLEP